MGRAQLLLPGDEHPPPSRASRDRDGDGHRSRPRAAADRGRRAARLHAGRHWLAGCGPRVPHQRRGSLRGMAAVTRDHHRAEARPAGPWVRDDSGVYEGFTVPRYYDTLMSKLIVWGVDRPAAIARMAPRPGGVPEWPGCGRPFPILRQIIAHEDFRAGRLSTAFLERVLPGSGRPRIATARSPSWRPSCRSTSVSGHATLPTVTSGDGAVSAWRRGARAGWSRS